MARFKIFLVLLPMILPLALRAQTVLPSAGLSLPLYNAEGSARSTAMGSALVGWGGGAESLFWNPAGLSGLPGMDLSLHHNSYFAGTFQESLLFGIPLSPRDGLAVLADYVNWGSFDERDSTGTLLGSFTDTDSGLGVGWGREWAKGFSAGLALRGLQQKVKDNTYSSLVGTLGLLWNLRPGWEAGAAYTNFGTSFTGSSNASDLKAGLSWRTRAAKDLEVLAALAGSWEANGVSGMQGGLEGEWGGFFSIRAGYRYDFSDNQLSGLAGLTAGAGLRFQDFRLDYAFLPSGDLGTSHRLSLGYEFPQAPPPSPVTITAPPPAPVTVVVPAVPTPAPVSPGSSLDLRFKLPEEGAPNETGDKDLAPLVDAVGRTPEDAQAWWKLGTAYYRLGKKEDSVQCFEQVLRLKPDNPKLRAWLETYEKAKP